MLRLSAIVSIFLLIAACGSKKDSLLSEINIKKEKLNAYLDTMILADPEIAIEVKELNNLYLQYASKNANDTLAPQFWYQAGRNYMKLTDFKEALQCFDSVLVKYPESELGPNSLYMKITIYEQFKNDHKATKEHYNQFINRFPDHELTPGFQTLLPYIGREEVYLDSVRQAKVITDSILN